MDDEDLGRIMSTLTTAIVDARNRAAQIAIDADFRAMVKHARDVHELLLEAMEEAPELVNDELRAYANDTNADIRGLEQLSGRPASWSAH